MSRALLVFSDLAVRQRRRPRIVRSLLGAPLALFGTCVLLGMLALAVFASVVGGTDPSALDLASRLEAPLGFGGSASHLLGTDGLGRDLLIRLAHGARISLFVASTAVTISCGLGVLLGLIAGYYGGHVDDAIMRLADVQLAFPAIILFIAVLAALGPGVTNLVVVLGLSGWVVYGRVVRGETLGLREREFIIAARSIGVRDAGIIRRHILPNLLAPVIVIATFSAAGVIIAEASLSFLGLGIPATLSSWGSMLADGQDTIRQAWWPATIPGVAIALTALGVNALGDWLRDYLDPRLQV